MAFGLEPRPVRVSPQGGARSLDYKYANAGRLIFAISCFYFIRKFSSYIVSIGTDIKAD